MQHIDPDEKKPRGPAPDAHFHRTMTTRGIRQLGLDTLRGARPSQDGRLQLTAADSSSSRGRDRQGRGRANIVESGGTLWAILRSPDLGCGFTRAYRIG